MDAVKEPTLNDVTSSLRRLKERLGVISARTRAQKDKLCGSLPHGVGKKETQPSNGVIRDMLSQIDEMNDHVGDIEINTKAVSEALGLSEGANIAAAGGVMLGASA